MARPKDKVIKELKWIVKDINVSEIADHLGDESLFNWCGVMREALTSRIEELEGILYERG